MCREAEVEDEVVGGGGGRVRIEAIFLFWNSQAGSEGKQVGRKLGEKRKSGSEKEKKKKNDDQEANDRCRGTWWVLPERCDIAGSKQRNSRNGSGWITEK